MKTLEKQVHFTAEGTSVGCYDSKGNPVTYLMIGGDPYIKLDCSVDRLLNVPAASVHGNYYEYYKNYSSSQFAHIDLTGVVNNRFIGSNNSCWIYAERKCTHRELASFHLAKYKAHKNTIKLLEGNHG